MIHLEDGFVKRPPLRGAAVHLLGEEALVKRWPHLLWAGPQPENQLVERLERETRQVQKRHLRRLQVAGFLRQIADELEAMA